MLDNTPDNRLTLTTCHPRFSAAQRLIVVAELDAQRGRATGPGHTRADRRPGRRPTGPGCRATTPPAAPPWRGGPWRGSVWLGAWYLGRLWKRKWTTYAIGTPVFLFVLFVFFENVSRLAARQRLTMTPPCRRRR